MVNNITAVAGNYGDHYEDDRGHYHGICRCGHDCSTHPDAGNPLAYCGDCGEPTCPDCRIEDDPATRHIGGCPK
jgi:hypothetical protein